MMVEHVIGDDRAVIYFDGDGPVALDDMTEAFAALARIYQRHFEPSDGETNPKLYVSRLKTGSIEAEIVPLLMLVGATVPYMDGAIVVRDFTKWIGLHVRAFAGAGSPSPSVDVPRVSKEDAEDLRAFLKPITGKYGAQLGVSHARYAVKQGDRELIAEYRFNEGEINRAAVNLDKHVENITVDAPPPTQSMRNEVLMIWHQTNVEPGKERGRTGDKAIIAAISEKPKTVYFPRQTNDLKRRMTQDEAHPFAKGYVVDVQVDFVDGEPKLYHIIDLHQVIDLDDE